MSFPLIWASGSSFNPNSIDGLKQLLLNGTAMSTDGTIYDERTSKGDARPIQLPRAYDFDGTDDFIRTTLDFTGRNTLTWFARINIAGFTQNDVILDQSNDTTGLGLRIGTSRILQAFIYDTVLSGAQIISTTTQMPLDTIISVAVVVSPTSVKLFIDGVLEKTETLTVTQIVQDTVGFVVGQQNDEVGNLFFDGKFYEVRGYFTALTDAQILQLHNGTYTGGGEELFYKCDDNHPTIAYDSSGNGNHGTKTGTTPATFNITDSTAPISFQNDVGYTLSGSVYIPRNEAIPTQDVLGNPLQYTGEVPYNALLKQANCGSFDGTNDYVASSAALISGSSAFTWMGWFNADTLTATMRILGQYTNIASGRCVLSILNTSGADYGFRFFYEGITGGAIDSAPISAGTWYHVTAIYTGAAITMYVNASQVSTSVGTSSIQNAAFTMGADSAGANNFFDGKMCDVRVYDRALTADEILYVYTLQQSGVNPTQDDLIAWYPFSEGLGTLIHDVSDNGNDGTATGITEATFWGTKQDKFFYNQFKGFDSYIQLDSTNDRIQNASTHTVTDEIHRAVLVFYLPTEITTASPRGQLLEVDLPNNFGGIVFGASTTLIANETLIVSWQTEAGSSIARNSLISTSIAAGWHTLEVNWDADNSRYEMTLDGTPLTLSFSGATDAVPWKAEQIALNSWIGGGAYLGAGFRYVLLEDINGTAITEIDFAENTGTSIKDKASGRTLTVYNATTPWRQIPALSDGSSITSLALPNHPGSTLLHNGNEAQIDFTGGVASPVAGSWETAWAFNTARTNPRYKRTRTSSSVAVGADRFTAFDTTLTGADATNMTTYTADKEL